MWHRIWTTFGALWVVAIIYLSLAPHPPQLMQFGNADKLEHALAYSLLMLWFCQCYPRQRILTALLLALMGAALEILQGLSGYRSFEYADMLANTAGVILGWLAAHTMLGRMRQALENRFTLNGRTP